MKSGILQQRPQAVTVACGLLALAIVFLNLRAPIFPGAGLDASWILSTDHAVKTGAVFGRDYIFTYGPYFRLAAPLFDPDRFGLVLIYDVVVALMVCAPALITRSAGALAALLAALLILDPLVDSLMLAALFGVFLCTLMRRNVAVYLLVAACGPLLLSKLSFILMFCPLIALADAVAVPRRKWPVFSTLLALSLITSLIAARQPMSALPTLAANSLAIILGYGRAMQLVGPVTEIGLAVTLSALLWSGAAAAALAPRFEAAPRRSAMPSALIGALIDALPQMAALLGLGWFLFIAFKAGFVRQDTHTAITFESLGLAAVVLWGYFGAPFRPLGRRRSLLAGAMAIAGLALLVTCYVAKCRTLSAGLAAAPAARADFRAKVLGIPVRIASTAGWFTGRQWREATRTREILLARLKRPFPDQVAGAVDAIPVDLAEIIASGLDYRPRPVIQSYSSYTPRLQRLDRDHFAGPDAPDTLFLKLLDVDNRLPTAAVGPSLPVIAARYDAVGTDSLGLILRRRATPRAVRERPLGDAPVVLNHWIPVPSSPGLVMAGFDLAPTPKARAEGFLFRDPVLIVHLRGASGQMRSYRFIPGMAAVDVAVSPMPGEGGLAALMLLDPGSGLKTDPVVSMMIEGHKWALKPGAVHFRALDIAPGLGAGVNGQIGLLGALASSDVTGHASLDGGELFAHAPTTLSADLKAPVRITGVIGVKAHPPGPPDDGVGFSISAIAPSGRETVLFHKALPPGPSTAPVDVLAPAGVRLVLKTETLANGNFDWSYWRIRGQAPDAARR